MVNEESLCEQFQIKKILNFNSFIFYIFFNNYIIQCFDYESFIYLFY